MDHNSMRRHTKHAKHMQKNQVAWAQSSVHRNGHFAM